MAWLVKVLELNVGSSPGSGRYFLSVFSISSDGLWKQAE